MKKFSASVLALLVLVVPTAWADAPGFSWLEGSLTAPHPDQGDSGHGRRLALSYALSPQAFMDMGAAWQNLDGVDRQRYGFGVGINSDPAAGYVLFARVGWNNIGMESTSVPGMRRHGFDAGLGIRTWLAEHWEVDAWARYTHNAVAVTKSDGGASVWYTLSTRVSLGAGAEVDADQIGYVLSLRFNY